MTDYGVLIIFIVFSLCTMAVGIYLTLPHSSVHYLGLNNTKINDTACRYTWLGGIDYNSFVRDISVDNVCVGHPPPGTVIHEGNCSAVVRMYMKDVRRYIQIYPEAYGV